MQLFRYVLSLLFLLGATPAFAADLFEGHVDRLPARIIVDGTRVDLCYQAPGFAAGTVRLNGTTVQQADAQVAALEDRSHQPATSAGTLTFKVQSRTIDGQPETSLQGALANDGISVPVKATKTDTRPDDEEAPIAPDSLTDVYPDRLVVKFRVSAYAAVYDAMLAEGVTLPRLDCRQRQSTTAFLIVSVDSFDVLAVARRLRTNRAFLAVGRFQTEKGSDSISVFLPMNAAQRATSNTIRAFIDSTAQTIAFEFFRGNKAKRFEQTAARAPSKRIFLIEGLSRDLAFGRPQHWEKYRIELSFYTPLGSPTQMGIDLRIVQGEIAAFNENARPPEARYEILDTGTLTELAAKVAIKVAQRFSGTYEDSGAGGLYTPRE